MQWFKWIMGLRLQTKVIGALVGVLLAMSMIGGWSAWQLQRQNDAYVALVHDPETTLSQHGLMLADQVNHEMVQVIWIVALLPSLVTLLGFSGAVVLARLMIKTVEETSAAAQRLALEDVPSLVQAMLALAQGDLTQKASVATGPLSVAFDDEFGRMAGAVNQLIGSLSSAQQALLQTNRGLREIVGRVQAEANGLSSISRQMGQAASQTRGVVLQVTQAVESVATGAHDTTLSARSSNEAVDQLSQAIESIARGATEQTDQVQMAANTTTQMAANMDQVASNAQAVATASQQTRASAERGAQAVRDTVAGMQEIKTVVNEAASRVEALGRLGEQIGAVVETIDDIAAQTNLLALNAAIEAARAGEQGRGFAVVADEVRKLAERSQRETRSIAELIREVQHSTRDAVKAMEVGSVKVEQGTVKADQAGASLGEILAAVETTVDQVNSIAAAAQEVAAGARSVVNTMSSIVAVVEESSAATDKMAAQAGQVTSAIQSIVAVSAQNSAAAEEVSASAEEMSAQVEEMTTQAETLAASAEQLQDLVAGFQLDEPTSATAADPIAQRRADNWRRDLALVGNRRLS